MTVGIERDHTNSDEGDFLREDAECSEITPGRKCPRRYHNRRRQLDATRLSTIVTRSATAKP